MVLISTAQDGFCPKMSLMICTDPPATQKPSHPRLAQLLGELVTPKAGHFPGHKSLCLAPSQPWSSVPSGQERVLTLTSPSVTTKSGITRGCPEDNATPTSPNVTKRLGWQQEQLWHTGHTRSVSVSPRCDSASQLLSLPGVRPILFGLLPSPCKRLLNL